MPAKKQGESNDGFSIIYAKPMGFRPSDPDEVYIQLSYRNESTGKYAPDEHRYNSITGILTKVEVKEYKPPSLSVSKIGISFHFDCPGDNERFVLQFGSMTRSCRELINRLCSIEGPFPETEVGVYCMATDEGHVNKGIWMKTPTDKVALKQSWTELYEKYVDKINDQNDYRRLDAIFFRLIEAKINPKLQTTVPSSPSSNRIQPSAEEKQPPVNANQAVEAFESEGARVDKSGQATMHEQHVGETIYGEIPPPEESSQIPTGYETTDMSQMEEDDLPF